MSVSDLLKIAGLTVELATKEGWVRPVHEVSLRIGAGEALGLVVIVKKPENGKR
jgi:ABC-type glutathione transport system ATPase component